MWKLHETDENTLWRQYMDELQKMDSLERMNWEISFKLSLNSTSTSNYSEDQFLEKLKSDEKFNERWGKLKK